MASYDRKEENINEIEKWLSTFKGGRVTLCKNEKTGIAEIILDHPNKRNAMSGNKYITYLTFSICAVSCRVSLMLLCFVGLMMVQLGEIVQTLENWTEGKAVLLRGEGSIFCSGGDLDFAKASAGAEGGFKMACYMHNVLSRLKALPMLSAALIHGQGI